MEQDKAVSLKVGETFALWSKALNSNSGKMGFGDITVGVEGFLDTCTSSDEEDCDTDWSVSSINGKTTHLVKFPVSGSIIW